MVCLGPWLLEDLAPVRDDDRVRGYDQCWLPFCAVDLRGVDVHGFLSRGLEDIFKGRERFWKVFGDGRGNDGDVGKTNVREKLFSSRRGRGKYDPFAAESSDERQVEWKGYPRKG